MRRSGVQLPSRAPHPRGLHDGADMDSADVTDRRVGWCSRLTRPPPGAERRAPVDGRRRRSSRPISGGLLAGWLSPWRRLRLLHGRSMSGQDLVSGEVVVGVVLTADLVTGCRAVLADAPAAADLAVVLPGDRPGAGADCGDEGELAEVGAEPGPEAVVRTRLVQRAGVDGEPVLEEGEVRCHKEYSGDECEGPHRDHSRSAHGRRLAARAQWWRITGRPLPRDGARDPSGRRRLGTDCATRPRGPTGQVLHDAVAYSWHNGGMSRVRVSTTVDESLLENARRMRAELTDSALLDEALEALVARHRAAEVDASYAAYDEHPLDEPDEWGDLASFREAAAAS